MKPGLHISNRGAWRNLLRLLMILSMWQAPVPFLHCHSLRAEDAGGDVVMRQHLVRFHREALSHPGFGLGWHVHFELPAEFFGCQDDDDSPARSRGDSARVERAAVAETRLEVSSPASPEIERLLPGLDSGDLRAVRGEARPSVDNFLTTFMDSTTINLLVCVARC